MSLYNLVAESDESTVVAEYAPAYSCPGPGGGRPGGYQSEAALEREFIRLLGEQGYEHLPIHCEGDLVANLRRRLEALNGYAFSDGEWGRFFRECIAGRNEGVAEKTRRIQCDHVQILRRDDGSAKNICLIDKKNIHNNRLQVINQYGEGGGSRGTRYDVTILVNGLPLVHVELKRRGVAIREAFNQIGRYRRESFWAASGLYEYVQIFVISNGTSTKYYSNTTRGARIGEAGEGGRGKKAGNSFTFTSCWADASNRPIPDLADFTRTFFARHTILNVLTKYCVFTAEDQLLVMRPYQIAATERILNRIAVSSNYRKAGTVEAGGYVWHTTGSGKTLTSFKTAQIAASLPYVDKVLFVVDRRDLDYQTMREYDRFEKGAANSNTSTRILQKQLEDPGARIIITTIQKLDVFIRANKRHEVYRKRVVIIFDECHRSQFGEMHAAITGHFRNHHIFGFTGTPIFAENAAAGLLPAVKTTPQLFGDRLHAYTIVDAIRDGNVLPFRIDYVNTVKKKEGVSDKEVQAIDTDRALAAPERVEGVVRYVLDHFDQKTKRDKSYALGGRRVSGFNSIFAAGSIPLAMKYYAAFKKRIAEDGRRLAVAVIYSCGGDEGRPGDLLPDESFDAEGLDKTSRDFLEGAIADYNAAFNTAFGTSPDKFQNYYKDISRRMKNREIDLLIVVNMFLTGFDATTLNTLWVDKSLRMHGLIQAFSRTNRILNSVKTFGNIVCFRDLREKTDEAIALFGDRDAGNIVLLKSYGAYYDGCDDGEGKHCPGYAEMIGELRRRFPPGAEIAGEKDRKDFIRLFGTILRLKNVLTAFDAFEGNEILSEREMQDYQSRYIDFYQTMRQGEAGKENINDDVIFEIELIRQVEVNIDYILMLVEKYHADNCKDREILVSIDKAVDSTIRLRSKKELIEKFIRTVNAETDVGSDWCRFVREEKDAELDAIIREDALKPEEARTFIDHSFRDGMLKTTGADLDAILPPISRFGGGRYAKKQAVTRRLRAFFEKYLGLV